jgi:hypothetical protein
MGFHDREYEVRVLLSDPSAVPPWVASVWSLLAAELEPLIQTSRDKTAVRTTQLSIGPGSSNQRGISFGRIGWSKQAASKWTHEKDGQLLSGSPAQFLTCQVWAPSWITCEREGTPPDVFFAIGNNARLSEPSKPQEARSYGSTCVLAVACDVASDTRDQVDISFNGISSTLPAVLRVGCKRPWGIRCAKGLFVDVIQDLTIGGLFVPGPRQNRPPSLAMLKDGWELFKS